MNFRAILGIFSSNVLSKGALALSTMLLIRFMVPAEYASFTLATAVVGIATNAFSSSFNRIYIVGRQGVTDENPSSFLGFQLLVMLGVLVLASPVYLWLGSLYWFVAALAVATCLSDFAKTHFQRQLQFKRFSAVELGRATAVSVALVGLSAWVGNGMKADQALLAQAAALLLVFSIAFGRIIEPERVFHLGGAVRFARTLLRDEYAYLFGYCVIIAMVGQVDVFVLSWKTDALQLATYGSAARYYALLVLALTSVHAVLLPLVQRAHSVAELRGVFGGFRRLVMMFIPIVVVGAWLSQWIIPLVDGGRYPGAVSVFRLLCVSAVVSFAFSPHVHLVMRFREFGFLFWLVVAGLAVNVSANLLLVPRLGAMGAASSSLLAFALINSSIFMKSRQLLNGAERKGSLQVAASVELQPEPA